MELFIKIETEDGRVYTTKEIKGGEYTKDVLEFLPSGNQKTFQYFNYF